MAHRQEDLHRQRLAKLHELRQQAIDPYPARYPRTHTVQEAVSLFEAGGSGETPLRLAGRVMALRAMGRATFLDLQDGTGKIQAYFRQDRLAPKYALLKHIDIGDFLGVEGSLFRTRAGEVTLDIRDFSILCKALQPLPEKWHGLTDVEKRYRYRYLDLIADGEVRQVFQLRSRLISAMRRFLDQRGFLEVETPVLWAKSGGAAARPFVTHHEALDRDLYLRVATELHLKRLVIGGLEKVYEIGRIFRNEGISTRHNPEFTSLESYEAYADYNDVMKMVEEMVSYLAREVRGTLQLPFNGSIIDLTPPWRRLTLREAIKEYAGLDFEGYPDAESLAGKLAEMGQPVAPGLGRGKLIDRLLSTFVEPRLIQPTFLLDYPVEMSPLAKRKPDNPRLVERFEGFAGGMEIANAFSELNDPREQRERFQEQLREREAGDMEAELPDEDFLFALEHGMPPTGGLGMGIDRLVMLFTDRPSIREVILFPQLRSEE